MADNDIRIDAQILEAFTKDIFTQAGLPPEDAAIEAEVLVWANLRGVDSHGVLRLPAYLANIESGTMNPNPNIKILKESAAVLYMDADRALGPVATVQAMDRVIDKARDTGIGWCLIRNVTHQGAMAYYAQMAAQKDMVGIAVVCSPPNMAPFGARAAGVHNSPIAIAVPADRHNPLSLDMATSVAAGGKLTLAADKRVPLGPDWALDAEGNPTTDPLAARILCPSGGPKGSGLALMFQCLTSQMANNPLIVPGLRKETEVNQESLRARHNQNSFVAALDISFFTEIDTYKSQIDDLIDELKALPRADGFDDVLMPGEPEFNTLEERSENGIPLPPGTVEKLRESAKRTQIALPEGL
jgi:LDH2 family malate/lactate/ureidoglycolate dehydrogenase